MVICFWELHVIKTALVLHGAKVGLQGRNNLSVGHILVVKKHLIFVKLEDLGVIVAYF